MNQNKEQLQRRLELIVDRYEMRRTGKTLFEVKTKRIETQKTKFK
jgi:hypothetical protein